MFSFLFSCRKTKTSTTRRLHNPKMIAANSAPDQLSSQSLIVHDSQHNNDLTRFYLTTADKLLEAKRLFSQGLSLYNQNHTSWETSMKLLSDSVRVYEQLLREINLDTVNLYEYGRTKERNQRKTTFLFQLLRFTMIVINLIIRVCI